MLTIFMLTIYMKIFFLTDAAPDPDIPVAVETFLPWKRNTGRDPLPSAMTHSMPDDQCPLIGEAPSWVNNTEYTSPGSPPVTPHVTPQVTPHVTPVAEHHTLSRSPPSQASSSCTCDLQLLDVGFENALMSGAEAVNLITLDTPDHRPSAPHNRDIRAEQMDDNHHRTINTPGVDDVSATPWSDNPEDSLLPSQAASDSISTKSPSGSVPSSPPKLCSVLLHDGCQLMPHLELPWRSDSQEDKLPQECDSTIEKLPWRSDSQEDKLPQECDSKIEKLPWRSDSQEDKLPQECDSTIEKLPWRSDSQEDKLPWRSDSQEDKLPWRGGSQSTPVIASDHSNLPWRQTSQDTPDEHPLPWRQTSQDMPDEHPLPWRNGSVKESEVTRLPWRQASLDSSDETSSLPMSGGRGGRRAVRDETDAGDLPPPWRNSSDSSLPARDKATLPWRPGGLETPLLPWRNNTNVEVKLDQGAPRPRHTPSTEDEEKVESHVPPPPWRHNPEPDCSVRSPSASCEVDIYSIRPQLSSHSFRISEAESKHSEPIHVHHMIELPPPRPHIDYDCESVCSLDLDSEEIELHDRVAQWLSLCDPQPLQDDLEPINISLLQPPGSHQEQQPHNPDSHQVQQPINPGSHQEQQPHNPGSHQTQQPINPGSHQTQQPINPGSHQTQQPINPGSHQVQQPHNTCSAPHSATCSMNLDHNTSCREAESVL